MDSDSFVKSLWEKVDPIVKGCDMELVDIEWTSKNSRWTLCVFIDKEQGITVDDCEQVSREISDLLDRNDPINHKYVLEVSSPGLDRPLKKRNDFNRFSGEYVKIRTGEPVNGQKNFKGLLCGLNEDDILLIKTDKGNDIDIPLISVIKANLWHRFDKNDFKRGGIKKK